jgi:hypothetical protein
MRLIAYQALLGNPRNVAQVQAARSQIERIGGRVSVGTPTKTGMVLVILELPEGVPPDHYLPGMPFYPM